MSATDLSPAAVPSVKDAGDALVSTAQRVPAPVRTAGLAAAGLAGGLAISSALAARRGGLLRAGRHTVLGLPVGRKRTSATTIKAVAKGAKRLGALGDQAARTADDLRAIRLQLEQANRRSPIEVVLDGLTHRRGAHRLEG